MEEFWKIADKFRFWVCSELRSLSVENRLPLRGDYLFIINEQPTFIVMVDDLGAWSIALTHEPQLSIDLEENCPFSVTLSNVQNIISFSAKTVIRTDSQTLQKLLLGTLKARVAFLTSKVVLSGDLPAFLKMVSLLKQNGVRPLGSFERLPI